jgi:hypothetical protein
MIQQAVVVYAILVISFKLMDLALSNAQIIKSLMVHNAS